MKILTLIIFISLTSNVFALKVEKKFCENGAIVYTERDIPKCVIGKEMNYLCIHKKDSSLKGLHSLKRQSLRTASKKCLLSNNLNCNDKYFYCIKVLK